MIRSYKPQLTPAICWAAPIQCRLTPGWYSLGSSTGPLRSISTSRALAMADSTSAQPPAAPSTIYFSANQPADLPARASKLIPTWELTPSRKGLRRDFQFKTFDLAWQFMDAVAQECKVQRHHPEWSNLYNRVTVEWTTHRPEGLSVKDVDMAEFCDRVAGEIGLKA
ncbi:4-alpha-hydroxytetrahydrobiopterin dehydratase [Ascochyta rabiei]|uniref:4a-hydroxytetrahydrobiopterin dehydratase n=1 Tax=Didymella rabiei TaxID=5454 RepID=A0A163M580_DIDRA|nr:4-alpha-hydroxytetrahydrobiopterin dehydratase [Ascochyta rabiei]